MDFGIICLNPDSPLDPFPWTLPPVQVESLILTQLEALATSGFSASAVEVCCTTESSGKTRGDYVLHQYHGIHTECRFM